MTRLQSPSLLLLSSLLLLGSSSFTAAWVTPSRSCRVLPVSGRPDVASSRSRSTCLAAGGGFGGSGGGASNKKPKETKLKLKPKQQWDRFQNLKTSPKMRVAVQTTDDDQWLEVGNVKAAETVSTAVAVARQRALIAEHAKRLFPLQISPKDTVIWAFWDTDTWTIVDKAILEEQSDSLPANVEKLIGFEGRPDPSSGYYCMYNEGRLVNDAEDARPSSKKLK